MKKIIILFLTLGGLTVRADIPVDPAQFNNLQGKVHRGDLGRSGVFNASGVSSVKGVQWRFQTGGAVKSSPVVVGGVAYFGSHDGAVYAVNAASGALIWSNQTGGKVSGSAAVVSNTVFIASENGKLYALNATNGATKWSVLIESGKVPAGSPAVAYGVVFIGAGSQYGHRAISMSAGSIYGYDMTTGAQIWKSSSSGPQGYAAIALDGTNLYAGVGGSSYGAFLLTTGANLWTKNAGSQNRQFNSMSVVTGAVFFPGAIRGSVSRYTPSGTQKWLTTTLVQNDDEGNFEMNSGGLFGYEILTDIAVANGLVYAGCNDGKLHTFVQTNGVRGWTFQTGGKVQSSPSVASNIVYFGSWDGKVYAVNATNGSAIWNYNLGARIISSPWPADGALYIGCDDGAMYCLSDRIKIETSTNSLSITEGATGTFGLRLSGAPGSGSITVAVSRVSGDTDISVSAPSNFVFSSVNWSNGQTVTLAAAQDADAIGGTAVIRCESAGAAQAEVTATELDDDLGVELSTNALTVAEGGTNVYRARLTAQPPATVTVTTARVSGDTDLTVSGGSNLVFTTGNWTNWQTITLAAAQDADLANSAAVFRSSMPGSTSADLTATEQDDDTLTILVSTASVIVPEGSTGTFQVKLSHFPPASVTAAVARVSGDTDVTVQSGASLLFTTGNWSSYQTVTLAAAEDADGTNGTAVIRCSSPGLANADVTAAENDNDDLTPPALTNAAALSTRTVLAQFSEPVTEAAAENTANYAINNGITVLLAVRDAADPRLVRLNVSVLSVGSYTLSVSNVTDLTGNPMPLNSKTFAYSTGPVVFFSEPLNSNPGWITTGDWAFGVPQGLGGSSGEPDPASGFTGTNVYGNNLNGDYADNIAVTNYLTTAAINCSGYTNIILSFRRWLGVETRTYDHANLQVSTNSTSWATVWTNPVTSLDGGSWTNVSYSISAVADRKTALYIRWGLGKTDGSVVYCGWNIDDIQLSGSPTGGSSGSGDGDTDGDQIVDWWEELYYGGATNANPSAAAANGGNTVLECYIAGLDPTDPAAAFLISDFLPLPSGNILQWPGVSGRVYTVSWSSNLLGGFQTLETNVPWTGNVFTDSTHNAEQQGFYRIEVKMLP